MNLTIFSKKCTTRDGKPFYKYLSTLTKKDGYTLSVQVKFREEAGAPRPDKCPMNIVVDKNDANLSNREYTRPNTGEIITIHTLWVAHWTQGEAYVDHSLDDFQ